MQGPGIGAHRGAHSERGIDGGAHGGALPDDGLLVRLYDGASIEALHEQSATEK